MNIFNEKKREVRCIRNDTDVMGYSKDNHLLEIGKVYHIEWMDVGSWYTEVGLKEFPDRVFNSVLFAEMDEEGNQ